MRKALNRLVKTGVSFTVEDVCQIAGVGKTFIYDKKHPQLTQTVLAARDASQASTASRQERRLHDDTSSWRERAINSEALSKRLRAAVTDRDARITDLIGQLYDPEGLHLADENAKLRESVATLTRTLNDAMIENETLRRSLEGARANVKRERERNVKQLFPAPASMPSSHRR